MWLLQCLARYNFYCWHYYRHMSLTNWFFLSPASSSTASAIVSRSLNDLTASQRFVGQILCTLSSQCVKLAGVYKFYSDHFGNTLCPAIPHTTSPFRTFATCLYLTFCHLICCWSCRCWCCWCWCWGWWWCCCCHRLWLTSWLADCLAGWSGLERPQRIVADRR